MTETMVDDATLPTEKMQEWSDVSDTLKVCFVCTGNTCRSPMAEAVLNHAAKHRTVTVLINGQLKTFRRVHAVSAGLSAVAGDTISGLAVKALEESGIASNEDNPYREHKAEQITEAMMRKTDLIVCMTPRHTMSLMMAFPAYADSVRTMPVSIADPFGGTLDDYRICLRQITEGIEKMFFADAPKGNDHAD